MSDLVVPMFIGEVINLLSDGKYDKIGPLCLYLLGVVVFSGVCVFFRASIFNIMSERIAKNLRRQFYETMLRKDVAFYDENKTGDLVSRLNSDIQVIQDSLSTNISMFVRTLIFILVTMVILLIISPVLMGTTIGAVFLIAIFAVFYGRKMK